MTAPAHAANEEFARRVAARCGTPKPQLRFDKVALRLVADVQTALRDAVPDGMAVAFTVTAPIRLRAKTTAALAELVRTQLARQPARLDLRETIHGNGVRASLVRASADVAPKVIGFVHNPGTDPDVLIATTAALLHGTP